MTNKLLAGLSLTNFMVMIYLLINHFYINDKVVYVDSSKIINNYQGMVAARKEYQNKIVVWKANIDTLTGEIRNDIVKYEKESPKMTLKEKELTKQLIQSKQQQLAQYQQATNDKATQEDAAATKKVIDEINAYIKSYGEERNYNIVFAATEYGNIAYAKEYLDITDKVIEGLNNKYAGTK